MNNDAIAPEYLSLASIGLIASLCAILFSEYGDSRPGASGAAYYRASGVLSALLAAVAFDAHIYWPGIPTTAFAAWFFWFFMLLAASNACKERLGARLKRCGRGIFFFLDSAQRLNASINLLEHIHPRHWLPFYQPWVLYKQGEITRAEMATAMFASAALVALAACFAAEKLPFATYAAPLLIIFTGMALSLDTDEARMKKLELTPADICWQKIIGSIFGLIEAGGFAGIGIILVQLVEKAHQDAQFTCIRIPPILENSRWLAAASLCCLPFFVLHIYHESLRGRALRAAGVRRTPWLIYQRKIRGFGVRTAITADKQMHKQSQQRMFNVFFCGLGSICAVFSFGFLPAYAARLEIFITAFCLLFYPFRKLAWFILFQNIQPLWKDWHAWRAAYLRARASWLLEWMMAALAPAPLLRFLSFRASPDTLERAGANASLMLAIFLLLPLLLRLGQKWRHA